MTFISSGFGIFEGYMLRFFKFCIVAVGLFSCETQEVKLQQLLLKGNIALQASQFEQATYYYEEAIKLDSCFSDAWNNLGTISFRSGQQDEAILRYDRAISCKPDVAYYLNRANAHFENKSFFSVLQDLEIVEKIKKDSVPAMALKGLTLARLLRYKEAYDLFSVIIKKDSLDPEHWVNRGTVSYYIKDYNRARPDLQKALELDSANSEAFNALAMISADEGSLDTAFDLIEQALKYSNDHPHYLNNRGYIRIIMGNLSEGEKDLNESMVREPDNPWVYRNKGILYLKLGKNDSAEKLFRQVLSMDSSVDKASEYLGLTLISSGKKSEGCSWLRKSSSIGLIKSNRCL